MRALAALGVLVFHVWLYREDRPRVAADGTLLDRVMVEANRPYARRRAARILPASSACGAGCVALYLALGPTTILPAAEELPAFALFAQSYSRDTRCRTSQNIVTASTAAPRSRRTTSRRRSAGEAGIRVVSPRP